MPDYIGYYAPAGTGGGSNTIGAASGAQSTDSAEANGTRLYTVEAGKRITGGGFYGSSAAATSAKIALYDSAAGKPTGSPLFVLDIPTDTGDQAWTAAADEALAPYVGQTLTAAVFRGTAVSSINIYRDVSFSGVVASLTADTNETAPDPWVEDTTPNTDLAFWLVVDDAPTGGSKAPLATNSSFKLTLDGDKKNVTVATGNPSTAAGDISLWLAASVDPAKRQSVVGTAKVLKRYILNNLSRLPATGPTVVWCETGGTLPNVKVDGNPTANDLRIEVGATAINTQASGYISETIDQLIAAYLEASTGN